MAEENSSKSELAEQNELLKQQIVMFSAMLESKDTQMTMVMEKLDTVSEKLETLLGAGTSTPSASLSRANTADFDSPGDIRSAEDEECDSRAPSSSKDYVIESRSKESYWRGTKNEQYIASMAEEAPILKSASAYFPEMHNLRFASHFNSCFFFIFIFSVLLEAGRTLTMDEGNEAMDMLNSIKNKCGFRNSWLNMLKIISLPYFNTLDPYLTAADDGTYQKRIWALSAAIFKCLFRGVKSFLYLDNVNGKKAKVTFPINLEIQGKFIFYF